MEQRRGLDGAQLQLLAMLLMLLDHGAIAFCTARGPFPALAGLYEPLRSLGRLSFPLFAFGILLGVLHSRDRLRYGLRLALCAALSQPGYMLLFGKSGLNVCVTLLLGLGLFCLLGRLQQGRPRWLRLFCWALLTAAFCCLAGKLRCDYGRAGLLLFGLLWLFRQRPWLAALLWGPLGAWLMGSPVQLYASLAAAPLYCYTGEKGRRLPKGLRYGFYPGHLLLLWGLKLVFMR